MTEEEMKQVKQLVKEAEASILLLVIFAMLVIGIVGQQWIFVIALSVFTIGIYVYVAITERKKKNKTKNNKL